MAWEELQYTGPVAPVRDDLTPTPTRVGQNRILKGGKSLGHRCIQQEQIEAASLEQ